MANRLDSTGLEYLWSRLKALLSGKYTKPSGGIPNSDLATPPTVMTGATSSVAGTAGYAPAPATTDIDKFLAGDGTYKSGGKPMVILSYGSSTWSDFINAYNSNVIVYCRASSNSNPANGSQTRMAFMAYVNDATNPTNVEFQYYRSVNTHSSSQMGDQVFVYKLESNGTWSVTTREASIKQIKAGTNEKIDVSWSGNIVTLSNTMTADDMPISSSDSTKTKAAIEAVSASIPGVMTGATASAAGASGTVPAPASGDNAKYLKGDGTWDAPPSLPSVSSSDNDKVLKVVSGNWAAAEAPSGLPSVTSSDNGKSLEVSNGAWAVGTKKIDKEYVLPDDWSVKTWTGLTSFTGNDIWTDGENTYYSNYSNQYVLDKSTSTWSAKTWTGLTSFTGRSIWTDGNNIYYSNGAAQYVLDKSTSTWSTKTWTGLTNIDGRYIWTDGENIYYSSGSTGYVLDKSTATWSAKTWTGLTDFSGDLIWTDGENTYYSNYSNQYVLDKSTSTWSAKTWTGSTSFYGNYVWTDGDNIYYSYSSTNRVLDKSTSTWSTKTWTGLTNIDGRYIWTDGKHIYYSNSSNQYEFNKPEDKILIGHNGEFAPVPVSTVIHSDLPAVTPSNNGKSLEVSNGAWAVGTKKIDKEYVLPDDWSVKTWTGLTNIDGRSIWTDGNNIYYSNSTDQYVFDKFTSTWSAKTWTGLTSFDGYYVWTDGENIYYSYSSTHRILDKSTSTWSTKTWSGLTEFYGNHVWTDGDNIYYSDNYALDKSTSTWSTKTWTGLTDFNAGRIWTDGNNIYYSSSTDHYILDKLTSTWSAKTWAGLTSFDGYHVWTDGENIYYSYSSTQYVLNKSTSTWSKKTWTGSTSPTGFYGSYIWPDGKNIYYSNGTDQYEFNKPEDKILIGRNGEFTPVAISTVIHSDLPATPVSDGTYIFRCTVSNGIATYNWELLPNASGVNF